MSKDHSIAIIGMGAVFPKSNGLKAYWSLIFNGEDAITDIPEESHWSLKDYFDENPAAADHTYCKRGGFIPKINFDPARYSFPPNNLEATDTSQLLGLMVAEMALEDAGYPAGREADHSRTSVILGITGTQELVIPLGARLYHPIWNRALQECGVSDEVRAEVAQRISDSFPKWQENSFPGLLGNVVAGRIANRLNLGGTNTVVDAACASSLSAIHTACLELSAGRCDISVSGGVDTLNDIFMHMCFSKTGVLSHTSDARPFSKDADGTVLGEGIGMVVLKRLEDAEKDNDRIYAVIKGIGTSSDGKTGGIYAPDAGGQLRALKYAYADAGVDPCTVELFEAHGTGTRVGDKIELTALKSLIPQSRSDIPDNTENIELIHTGNTLAPAKENLCDSPKKNHAAVGSVKSMIGHAKAAAGAAGLIKAVLSLHHKVIPPTLKAQAPDPEIEITNSPFYLNSISKPWVRSKEHPRRCGVSAFGFGGSNFHLVLEEYSEKKSHISWDGSVQIAAFSSDTRERLKQDITKFKESMDSCAGWDSREKAEMVAWITSVSREKFKPSDKYRVVIMITEKDDPGAKAAEVLEDLNMKVAFEQMNCSASGEKISEKRSGIFYGSGKRQGKIGFLFPGQGSQYTGMGRELCAIFPEASDTLELACRLFSETSSTLALKSDSKHSPLKEYLFPPPLYVQSNKISEEQLRSTDIAQPAIGAVSLAMAKILMSFGIRPHATCGHSFGELTAMCAAGWIDDATFFNLACARGKFMAGAAGEGGDPGTMFAVKASLAQIEQLIKSENLDLIIANRNSPDQVVLSGRSDEIKRAAQICKKYKLQGVELTVAAAFHSSLVKNAVEPFKKSVNAIKVHCSDTEVFSNTTGGAYPQESKKIKTLLGEQLINPVHFMSNIESMFKNQITTFVEVGPKTVLSGLTRSILDGKEASCFAMDSSSGKNRAVEDLAHLLCSLAASGVDILLKRWEDPVKKPAKKIMRVALTGANVKPVPQSYTQSRSSDHLQLSGIKAFKSSPEKTIDQGRAQQKKNIPNHSVQKSTAQSMPTIEHKSPVIPHNRTISSYSPELKGTDMKKRYIQQPIKTETDPHRYAKRDGNGSLPAENQPSLIYSVMQMVQKGMESMQELQTRTALAHEKFLDTQSAASRTLQAMMEQTRFFAENAIYSQNHGHPPVTATLHNPDLMELNHTEQAMIKAPDRIEPPSRAYEPHQYATAIDQETVSKYQQVRREGYSTNRSYEITESSRNNGKKGSSLNISSNGVTMHHETDHNQSKVNQNQPYSVNKPDPIQTERLLLETVSKLTGFPVEMLTLDMDIESDLGIDSIKRVEIVSELEKALPGSDALTPDNMGTLRTLKDICQALAPVDQPRHQSVPTSYIPEHRTSDHRTPADGTSSEPSNNMVEIPVNAHPLTNRERQSEQDGETADKGVVMAILMETISELTGFPVEMLAPEMDLESDLGIDSIKRVEILSKLEEKLPRAGLISPDDLGRLKTLEQIAQQISGEPQNLSSEKESIDDSDSKTLSEVETVACEKKNC